MIARVRLVNHDERSHWLSALEGARVERHPDLVSAATACGVVLASIAETLELGDDHASGRPETSESEWLQEAHAHLLAHCRAVLGRDPLAEPDDQASSTRSTR